MPAITGQCYCGASRFSAEAAPQVVATCHCVDCKRWTGAPSPTFAAFATDDLTFDPPLGPGFSTVEGVKRWTCPTCASPLAAWFSYLPDQLYVPIGLIDQAADHPPSVLCHTASALPWVATDDQLTSFSGTARTGLAP